MARPWSLERLAAKSGEPEDRLRRYVDAGLLHRQGDGDFEPDSLHRLRLIQFARSRGVTDERLVAAAADQGDLLGGFDELTPVSDLAVDLVGAAEELGLDEPVIRELAGILDWDDTATGSESDLGALQVLARALSLGIPRDALMQMVRVIADAMDRLADAEVRTFHDYVHERFRAQGLVGRELLEVSRGVGRPVLELAEPSIVYFHRRAYDRASREDLLRHLAEPMNPPSATPGEEQATVLFVDLVSFTPMTETMGDQAAADVLRTFSSTVRGNAARYGGRIVKQIGDAFMLMFARPRQAIEFGCAMDRFVDDLPQFPALHIGAHSGSVLYREGEYVGATVNLAARVASAGAAGQFLITEDLRDAAGELVGVTYKSQPPRRLKGIADPICLVEVRRLSQSGRHLTDPVCGMILRSDDIKHHLTWQGIMYAFCSERCMRAFMDDPVRFAVASPV
jgi:adenylate cyclase